MPNKKKTNSNSLITNVVPENVLRTVQMKTLTKLRDAIIQSFGPKGSNTMILKENMYPKYTKDGHEIIEAIHFNNGIEQAIKENILNLTTNIVKEVGDGSTSGVILSSIIFENLVLNEYARRMQPHELMKYFQAVVNDIKEEILKNGRECTLDDIYDIAMISSNSNEFVAETMRDIYKQYGLNVFVDVFASMGQESYIKVMDGMTLPTGMMDTCFINQGEGRTAKSYIRNPYVYVFEDPIDTPEMMIFLDAILKNNIISPLVNKTYQYIPTVILAPKLSKDMSAYLDKIVEMMNSLDNSNKPPVLIVSDIYDSERYTDISLMCGCKPIKKYIDPKLQEKDIEAGLAPTPDTVYNFFGRCELVESNDSSTKFVNPKNMYNENGEYTADYNNLLTSLEGKLSRAQLEGSDLMEIGKLKRRINSLKSNLVEFYVGGISMSDREALRASVEDTVKNCRSAAANGVGYGANFEGMRASRIVKERLKDLKDTDSQKKYPIARTIADSYEVLINLLYMVTLDPSDEIYAIVDNMTKNTIERDMPINLANFSYDGKVLSSITSDIIVLETIAKIISIMYTCNQCIMPTAYHNVYMVPERYDEEDFYTPTEGTYEMNVRESESGDFGFVEPTSEDTEEVIDTDSCVVDSNFSAEEAIDIATPVDVDFEPDESDC